MTDSLFALLLGILLTFIGFRMYSYYEKNLEANDERSKKFGKSVLLIIMGLICIALAIIIFFK